MAAEPVTGEREGPALPEDWGEVSLGILEVKGFVGLVEALDRMLKSATVQLVKYEHIGGDLIAACVKGDVGAVKLAVELGLDTGRRFGECAGVVLSKPHSVLARFVESERLPELISWRKRMKVTDQPPQAFGFIETRGLVPLIAALDAMTKAANIALIGYEKGQEQLTALVIGDLAGVSYAIEAGAAAAQRVGEVVATHIIGRPAERIRAVLPTTPRVAPALSPGGPPAPIGRSETKTERAKR